MDRGDSAAARLPESERTNLATQALAGSETVSDLAARHGVSRKFVYQQTHKACMALDDAFSSATASVKNLGRYAASWIAWWQKRPSSRVALT